MYIIGNTQGVSIPFLFLFLSLTKIFHDKKQFCVHVLYNYECNFLHRTTKLRQLIHINGRFCKQVQYNNDHMNSILLANFLGEELGSSSPNIFKEWLSVSGNQLQAFIESNLDVSACNYSQ